MPEKFDPNSIAADPSLAAGNRQIDARIAEGAGAIALLTEAEADTNFSAMAEKDEVEQTQQTFNDSKLLARAMEGPAISRRGIEFPSWDEELDLMAGSEGMAHVSSTLLVPGRGVRVYKPTGFLVDSDNCEVEHVSKGDSGSRVTKDGKLVAVDTQQLESIDDLARHVQETGDTDMNEVNVTINDEAIRGIFTTNSVRAKLQAKAAQLHFGEEGHGELPVFLYDNEAGSLEPWEPSQQEIEGLINKVPAAKLRETYSKTLL